MNIVRIQKAVIPAAGLGTRMLPAAKAVAKELLPVLDRPAIQYVVEEAAAAGIDDVLLISSPEKRAVESHFKPNPLIDDRLRASKRENLLASINQLIAKVKVHAVDQPKQLGLGDAVRQARNHVGDEPFLCLLGDTIFSGDVPPAKQLADAHAEFGTSVIGIEEVPLEKVTRYGIVGGDEIRPGVLKLTKLIEKPTKEAAPSRFAIAARYLLTPAIFKCIDEVKAGAGGEIQLTDALQLLLQREPIHAIVLRSKRHDIGSPIDWLKTNLAFARRDENVWREILPLLRELMG